MAAAIIHLLAMAATKKISCHSESISTNFFNKKSNRQVVSSVMNYQNKRPIPNVALGLYFYRIRVVDGEGQVRYYSGRLMITE